MILTTHFSLSELLISETAERKGIDNRPGPDALQNLKRTARGLEEVRSYLGGHPIVVSSGFRCLAVNREVGSSDTSDHIKGLAADFNCPRVGSARVVIDKLADSAIDFDQLILEYPNSPSGGWVHIGFGERRRRQLLIIDAGGTRPLYA